ncbi:hypothetical protein KKH13_05265, partial [Patescibacteria group bacterium]|nr:hypothetical protein [Patescibacteria group bacterium]
NIGAPALNAFGITSTSGGNFLFNAAGSAAGNVATSSGASALASLLSSSSTGLPYGAAVGEFGAVSGGLAGVAGPLAAAAPYALGAAAIAGLAYLIASSQTHANYGTIGPSTGTIAGGALGFTPFDITPPGTYGVKHQDAEASQRLAESVNQGAQAITDAFNEQMVQLIPLLGDNFVDSIEGTVIEFAAKYNSGFEGFSISDQGDFQADLENILTHISKQLWASVIPMIETGAANAIEDFRSSAAGARMGSTFMEAGTFVLGGRANFASDEEYINAVRDFLTLQQNASDAWDSINSNIDKQLGLLTPYEQQLANVNTQFDTWIATLEALGYSAEALATIEGRRTDVLDKLAEDEAARQAAAAAKTAAQRVKELANEIENLQQAAAAAAQPYEALRGSIQPYLIGQARRDWQASDYAYRYQELEAAFGALDPSAADYRDESIRIMEEQYEVLQAIEQLNQEQVQQTGALIGSLSDTIDRIIGGDLAAYQSPGWYGQRYASLLSSARGGDQAAAEAFNQFVPQYLEFMGAYGGNYSQLSSAVLQDLEGLKKFYEGQQDLATNEMLLQTTISTNSLLEALLHKADEQIAAIHQQAAAETAAKQAALDAANNAAVAQYIASLSSAEKAQINAEAYVNRYSDLSKAYYETYYPGDIVYWAQKHWADFGQAEKRTYGADLEAYARSILGLQHGGTAYAGVPYWVGEMGMPEVIIPNQTSTVVSNNTIRQAFDPEAIGDAVARAVMPAIAAVSRAGGEVHVHLNSREIAYAFAEEIPRNGDLQYAISRVPARSR